MTKQADALRKRFTAADRVADGARRPRGRSPMRPKVPDDVKKLAEALEERRWTRCGRCSSARNFVRSQASAEERKAELAKPEPDFVLPRADASAYLADDQSAGGVRRRAERDPVAADRAGEGGDRRCRAEAWIKLREQVVKFNDAMNAAKVPFIAVP